MAFTVPDRVPASVAPALRALEECGLLTVWNRLLRVRWKDPAAVATRIRVLRTSNCYLFSSESRGDKSSKAKLPSGTGTQVSNPDLFAALDRLQKGIRGVERKTCAKQRVPPRRSAGAGERAGDDLSVAISAGSLL